MKGILRSKTMWLAASAVLYALAMLVQHYVGDAEMGAGEVSSEWRNLGLGVLFMIARVVTKEPLKLPGFLSKEE